MSQKIVFLLNIIFLQEKCQSGSAAIPASFPSNESCTMAGNSGISNGAPTLQTSRSVSAAATLNLERHEEPRFCVCLQQMPEPNLSPDWFDMQPTRELNGGQVQITVVEFHSGVSEIQLIPCI